MLKTRAPRKYQEGLRGVAADAENVPLMGSVVLKIEMVEIGKSSGPTINVRFKITEDE